MEGSWMVVAVLVALAASGQSTPVRRARDARCVAQDNFVSLASDESCVKYYQCYSGNAYLLQCPDNTWFNEETQICDDSHPPNGCDLAPAPLPPPEIPDESEENIDEEQPEGPEEEDTAPVDENENEDLNEGDGDEEDSTDNPEDVAVDPEENIEEEGDSENLDNEEPADELADEETDDQYEPIVEPDDVLPEQEEQLGETEGEDVPINNELSDEQEPAGEPNEGSGDPDNQDFAGNENNELPDNIPEEETTDANIGEGSGAEEISTLYRALFATDEHESGGEISQSQDVDFILDELFEVNIGDESYEEPSIEPVFAIPNMIQVLG